MTNSTIPNASNDNNSNTDRCITQKSTEGNTDKGQSALSLFGDYGSDNDEDN
jgi:hypothetical protein